VRTPLLRFDPALATKSYTKPTVYAAPAVPSGQSNEFFRLGELFMARNENGYFMQGRILTIKDDRRGDDADGVCVQFQIGINGKVEFQAL
jgi:hypothetical protein